MSNFTESQIIMNELFQPFSSSSVEFEKIVEGVTTFGKIKLNVNNFPITKKHLDLDFNIDNSGSMSFSTPDGKTKMQHMNFTVENILRYLREHNVSATICVNTFDDKIVKIIQPQELKSANIELIANKIRQIRPIGGTNIGKVLEMEAAFTKPKNYSSERVFLMFTDGQAVDGIIKNSLLKEIADKISDTTTIVTVGCGTDHDYELLSSIASRRNSSYKFIGKLEEAAMACGEILDKILNKIIKNVEISVQNGEIYDWKINKWTNKIQTENIVGSCDKTYNVRSLTPAEFNITITGIIVETDEPFEYSIVDRNMDQDLKKDEWRQKTLELLYEVNSYNSTRNMSIELSKELKSKLKELMVNMKKYMDDNQLRDDLFMKMLTDDIFIAHTTFGTTHGHMYVASRQTSQATQGIHNNTVDISKFTKYYGLQQMSRGVTCQIQKMYEDDEYGLSKIPINIRGSTCQIQQMYEDEEYELPNIPVMMPRGVTFQIQKMYEDEKDEEDEEKISRLPSNYQNCSIDYNEEDEDTSFSTPSLQRTNCKSIIEFIEEEEDVFSRHVTLESDVSPYANLKTISIMREVSYTPKKSQDEDVP
jgi:hypothetical protein